MSHMGTLLQWPLQCARKASRSGSAKPMTAHVQPLAVRPPSMEQQTTAFSSLAASAPPTGQFSHTCAARRRSTPAAAAPALALPVARSKPGLCNAAHALPGARFASGLYAPASMWPPVSTQAYQAPHALLARERQLGGGRPGGARLPHLALAVWRVAAAHGGEDAQEVAEAVGAGGRHGRRRARQRGADRLGAVREVQEHD